MAATISMDQSGNWNDPSSWDPNQVPTSADDVIIGSGFTASSGGTAAAGTLTVSGKNLATLSVTGGSLTTGAFTMANSNNHEAFYNQSGGVVSVNGDFNVATANRSTAWVNLSGGSLTVTGDMTLSNANSASSSLNLSDAATLTVNGTLDLGPAGNPQNSSSIVNDGIIFANDLIIGSTSLVGGTGSIVIDNNMTVMDGALYGLSIDDGLLLNDASIFGDLFLGESAGDTWNLLITDLGGLDEIGASDILTLFTVGDELYVDGVLQNTLTDITNVNLIFDASVTGIEQDQFANAVVRYDPNTGEVFITNIVPLPNALTLGLVVLLGALIYSRPKPKRANAMPMA